MHFTVKTRGARRRSPEEASFTIDRLLARHPDDDARDVSHAVDRTYRYRSLRELRWHLADRFGLPVADVALTRA